MGYQWGPYEHPGVLIPRLVRTQIGNDFSSLLDVGGGEGTVGHGGWGNAHIAVLDIWQPNASRTNLTLGNALDVVKIYNEKSFDVVIACELIEHLEFEDGERLLPLLETVACKIVILTTPHGFSDQDPSREPQEAWAVNPYQKHLSGWYPHDFVRFGYTPYYNGNESGEAAQLIAWKVIKDAPEELQTPT